jgi:hypothetical protein
MTLELLVQWVGMVLAVLALAGLVWALSGARAVPVKLRRVALACMVIAVAGGAERVLSTRAWLPQHHLDILRLIGELSLLIFGLALLGVGAALHRLGGRPRHAAGGWLLIVSVLGFTTCLCQLVLVPTIGGPLGWGWYGLTPEVNLRSVADVTRATGLRFPVQTVLMDGTFFGGLEPYAVARVRLPRDGVTEFLYDQPFTWEYVRQGVSTQGFPRTRQMSVLGWPLDAVRSATIAHAAAGPEEWYLLIDQHDGDSPILYLQWFSLKPVPRNYQAAPDPQGRHVRSLSHCISVFPPLAASCAERAGMRTVRCRGCGGRNG